ncbi:hypothetical protein Ndes2526B_g03721 [Nannochloris sp. 'desiccata']
MMSDSEYGVLDSDDTMSAEYNTELRQQRLKSKNDTKGRKGEESAAESLETPLKKPKLEFSPININNDNNCYPFSMSPTPPPSSGNALLSSSLADKETFEAAMLHQAAQMGTSRSFRTPLIKPVVQLNSTNRANNVLAPPPIVTTPAGGLAPSIYNDTAPGSATILENPRVWRSRQYQKQQGEWQFDGGEEETKKRKLNEVEERDAVIKRQNHRSPPAQYSPVSLHPSPLQLKPKSSPQMEYDTQEASPPQHQLQQQQQQQKAGSLPVPLSSSSTPPHIASLLRLQHQQQNQQRQYQRHPLLSPRSLQLPASPPHAPQRRFPTLRPPPPPPPVQVQPPQPTIAPQNIHHSTESLLANIDKVLRAASEQAVLHHQLAAATDNLTRQLQQLRGALQGLVTGVASGIASSPRFSALPVALHQQPRQAQKQQPMSPPAEQGKGGGQGGVNTETFSNLANNNVSIQGNRDDTIVQLLDYLISR